MIYKKNNLKSIDITIFKTDNIIIMFFMFFCCKSLTSIDLTKFKIITDYVNNIRSMFKSCESLTSINLKYLNLKK